MKSFKEFINEANNNSPIDEEDIEEIVSEYFDENVMGEDAYDRESDRIESLKAAANRENDPLTDSCISYVAEMMGVDVDEIEKFREYIEDQLADLAEAEL